MKKTPTILVTGGAGFIGNQLTCKLLAEGFRVVVVDDMRNYRPYAAIRSHLETLQDTGQIHWLQQSIKDAIPNLLGLYAPGEIALICHLAATPGVRTVEANPRDAVRNNIDETNALLAYSDAAQIPRIVFASSSSVYGSHPEPVSENALCAPRSLYARQKLQIEQMLKSRAAIQRITIARLFSVYGPGIRPDLVLFSILEQLLSGGVFTQFGDGFQQRDWTYIDDAIDALMMLVRASLAETKPESTIWNIGAGKPYSLAAVIQKLEQLTGRTLAIRQEEAIGYEPKTTHADCTRMHKKAWHPKVDMDAGLAKLFTWYMTEIHGQDEEPI